MTVLLRCVTWNAHVGRADELRQAVAAVIADTHHPHLLSLQEVWDWSGTVPGYRRVQADPVTYPHHEARSTVLLVRKRGVRVRGGGAVQVDGDPWVYHRLHPPRVFPFAQLRRGGVRWDVMGVHRCPGGPTAARARNRRAWQAEHRLLVGWADAHRTGPLVLLGDHNDRATDDHQLSVSGLAGRIGGQLALERIDGAIVRGCRVERVRTLPDWYGSDHRPVTVTLSAERR